MSENIATTPKKEPTAGEAMFFYAIVKHMKNKADIDWESVAAEQGFKSAEVAKVRFGQVKRKLGINNAAETPVSSARASGKKRDTGSSGPGATPTKVAKNIGRTGAKGGPGRGRGKVKKEEPAEDAAAREAKTEEEDDDATVKDEYPHVSQFEENMSAMLGEDDPF